MQVNILSRQAAIAFCKEKHNYESAIISISDPYTEYDSEPFADSDNNVVAILRVSFSDADTPGRDVYGREVEDDDLITDKDAATIVDFVERYKNNKIIVHCDAGISRSSGVAAAILKHYTGNDDAVFDSRYFHPNMRCYFKVLKAFEGSKAEEGKVSIPLPNGFELRAEGVTNSEIPAEIYVGILDKNGAWHQDLAIIRLAPDSDNKSFEVLVYADKDDEDYTNRFHIGLFEE